MIGGQTIWGITPPERVTSATWVPHLHVNRPLDTVNTRKKETVVIGNMLKQEQRILRSGSCIYQLHLRKMIF